MGPFKEIARRITLSLALAAGLFALLLSIAACATASTPTPTATLTVGQAATATPTPTPTVKPPLPPNGLEKALEEVPVEYKDKRLIFANYGRARSLIGVDDTSLISNLGWQELNDSFKEQEGRHSPYSGMLHLTSFFMVFLAFNKEFGLEESLWPGALSGVAVWHDISGPDSPMFLSVGATFPTDPVIEKLLESGSEEADYQGVTYYSRNEDYLGSSRDPLTKWRAILNRVTFIEDRFLAASATATMTSLIDAEQGTAPSLADNRAHKAIAEAVGPDMLAGIFRPYSRMNSDWAPGSITDYRGTVIMDGPDRWESLSVFEVVLVGYRVVDGVDEIVTALYYPDPNAAAEDAAKLRHRWETYVASERYNGFQLVQGCAPLSTRVIEGEDFSVLEASCPVLWHPSESFHRFQSSRLWQNLSIDIFTQDIEKLREAVESGQE